MEGEEGQVSQPLSRVVKEGGVQEGWECGSGFHGRSARN